MVDRVENYQQDRLGNTNRELDQLRSQDGMEGADADDDGIIEVTAGDTGNNLVVYEIPDGVSQVILDLIHAHNNSGGSGTFRILEATLDNNGNIGTTTRRSVLVNVADGATRALGYEGKPFQEDAIVVNSSFSGEFGFAVLADSKQEDEPNVEQ